MRHVIRGSGMTNLSGMHTCTQGGGWELRVLERLPVADNVVSVMWCMNKVATALEMYISDGSC